MISRRKKYDKDSLCQWARDSKQNILKMLNPYRAIVQKPGLKTGEVNKSKAVEIYLCRF
jgi:hypothetical protein